MAKQVKVGLLGLGTVGRSVLDLLVANRAVIQDGAGVPVQLVAACDIKAKTKRIKGVPVVKDALKVINDPSIDIIVEAIGGVKPALNYILKALASGKHVVTSNKEVIAKYMPTIFAAAKKNKVLVLYEAAVGGGVPIIQAIRDNLAANHINEIYGIVNGTTNYILDSMTKKDVEFADALKDAQARGFAEANPAADVEGYDAAYKAAILAATAYGAYVDCNKVHREGITKIRQEDIQYAKETGYVIKLIATARKWTGNKLDVRVHPVFVHNTHPLAKVSENYNAIFVKGDYVGQVMFHGEGAGGKPTASAVVSDIIKIARGGAYRVLSQAYPKQKAVLCDINQIERRYYFNLKVPDRSGVLAVISKAFAKNNVSIQAVTQRETVGKIATLIIVTHAVSGDNIQATLRDLAKLSVVKKISNVVRVGLY
ncbi:MAG: homoserine dehydrogenase [Candidatus Margulisbacteria bacterium]|nr:homoserine dehydrogenase [Candidatus Margulisiibacteriota bacterium]MBU1022629.1 homoserine dehydrogenase [Candidatus Margulisiibacteriota bacterium]MBU1729434.1 homoserine dehydrogenase [Candidatus Margulisiibacteriota bacterium]MBU1955465.1 homoserine dehydrogenase [Candidatus Margulisiibacteriota bacterium]